MFRQLTSKDIQVHKSALASTRIHPLQMAKRDVQRKRQLRECFAS
jgi:hypothetical protein